MTSKLFSKYKDEIYFAFRLIIGLMFAFHGALKFGLFDGPGVAGFSGFAAIPMWLGFLVALIELGGGIMIATGLWAPYGAFAGAILMIVAYIKAHSGIMGENFNLLTALNPIANKGELAIIYVLAFLVIMSMGSGKYSLQKYV